MTIPKSIWIGKNELAQLSKNTSKQVKARVREPFSDSELEYVLNSDPPRDIHMSSEKRCGFSGGREGTPFAEIVPCSYYRAEPGEVSIEIEGRCSVATLDYILHWAKRNTIEKTNPGGERYRIFAGDE